MRGRTWEIGGALALGTPVGFGVATYRDSLDR
jgi:hypothetical protein